MKKYNKQKSINKLDTTRIFRTVSWGVCKKVARNMLNKDSTAEISGVKEKYNHGIWS